MAMMDGRAFAQERLMDNAALVLNAYYKAPLVTSRINQQALMISGEDLLPMLEVIELLIEKVGGDKAVQSFFYPLYMDYYACRVAIDKGQSPVFLLLGANLSKADLGWDCGACGFKTCGKLMKHFREKGGPGRIVAGPSCAWKALDYGIACDYACAAAWELNIENRIEGSFGLLGMALGYLDDCTAVLALPLGPVTEFWYYNRPTMADLVKPENQLEMLRHNVPNHWMKFSGDLHPPIKGGDDWWSKPPEYVSVGPDAEYTALHQKNTSYFLEAVQEVYPRVAELKRKMKENQAKSQEKTT